MLVRRGLLGCPGPCFNGARLPLLINNSTSRRGVLRTARLVGEHGVAMPVPALDCIPWLVPRCHPPQAWYPRPGHVPKVDCPGFRANIDRSCGQRRQHTGNNGGFLPGSGVSAPTAAVATVATVMPLHQDRMRGPYAARGSRKRRPPSIGRTAPMRTKAANTASICGIVRRP